MLRVGLTGGTGAGKTTVAARLAGLGSQIVDADVLARRAVEPGSPGLVEVVREFGPGVLDADGALDRAALAAVVFTDPERRRALESITHPRIAALSRQVMARAPRDAVLVHDVPLLVERGMGPGYHLVVVVGAPERTRVDRLAAHRGLSRQDAWARVRSQASDDQRRAAADVWLDGAAALDDVLSAVDDLWHGRLVPFERNLRLRRLPTRPDRVVVAPADPAWGAAASRLLARIATVTGPQVLRADHIGSTAVPGLDAQDVLDLQLVVPDLAAAAGVADAVASVGLVRRPGRWRDELLDGGEHDKVLAGSADPARAVNLHVREVASPAWREAIALRDRLRGHPDQAAGYAALKHGLAAAGRPLEEYTAGKTDWIRAAVDRAREGGLFP